MLALKRIEEDRGDIKLKSVQGLGLVEALTDWTVWWLAIAECLLFMGVTYRVFFPTITSTMGYGATVTLLLCAPPWLVDAITSMLIMRCALVQMRPLCSWPDLLYRHSDATRDRFWHIAGLVTVSIIGFLIAISTMDISLRYLSLWATSVPFHSCISQRL